MIRPGDVAVLRGFDAKSKSASAGSRSGEHPWSVLQKHVLERNERRIKATCFRPSYVKGPARLAKRQGSVLTGKSLLGLIRSAIEAYTL